MQTGEFALITYILRNIQFSFQVQIPQIEGFSWAKKPTQWGISLISSNLRNIRDFIQLQIPQIVVYQT